MQVIRLVLYTVLLILIETAICILSFEGELFFKKYKVDSWHIQKAMSDALEVNAVRFIFYYILYAIPFYMLVNLKRWNKRLLQIALINCALYIVISLLYSAVLPGAFEFFSADFFYVLVAATFLSPFILGRNVQQKLINT